MPTAWAIAEFADEVRPIVGPKHAIEVRGIELRPRRRFLNAPRYITNAALERLIGRELAAWVIDGAVVVTWANAYYLSSIAPRALDLLGRQTGGAAGGRIYAGDEQ